MTKAFFRQPLHFQRPLSCDSKEVKIDQKSSKYVGSPHSILIVGVDGDSEFEGGSGGGQENSVGWNLRLKDWISESVSMVSALGSSVMVVGVEATSFEHAFKADSAEDIEEIDEEIMLSENGVEMGKSR